MRARYPVLTQAMRTARTREQQGGCPRARCPACARECAVYWPTGGDGSARVTFWHKDDERRWCRAEVDLEAVLWEERP